MMDNEMETKKAFDFDEAQSVQECMVNRPHGWVHWKGTDVCMDLNCKCGELSHFDGDFCYTIQCPTCKTVYFCNGHIELIEIEKYDIESVKIAEA